MTVAGIIIILFLGFIIYSLWGILDLLRELKKLLEDKVDIVKFAIGEWIYYNMYENEVYKAYWN